MDKIILVTNSPTATFNLGKWVGKRLEAGNILALTGELGGGKTLFTRGVCAGLGVPDRRVNSPTFVLVNEYRGRLPVYHMDLYRLRDAEDGIEIGMLDYLARAGLGVMIVEWAEKIVAVLPKDYLLVEFRVIGASKREISFSATGPRSASLIKGLRKK